MQDRDLRLQKAQNRAGDAEKTFTSCSHASRQPLSTKTGQLSIHQTDHPACSIQGASVVAGKASMGSRRGTDDPAADTAAADADAGPGPAAAADQPSSSEQQFVNEGLQTWLERRRQWTQKPPDYKRAARKRAHSPAVTPEQVLSFTPFPKPVALQDVIEVLQEVWEQEDYY